MRLDKFLFFTRLTKTRGLAQDVLAAGHVRIDGRVIQSGHAKVSPGMVITLPLQDRVRVIRVVHLPVRRGPAAEAQACYVDLAPDPIDASPKPF